MRDFFKFLSVFFLVFSSLSATEPSGFLTADDIALFYQQGYLLKPKCFTESEVKSLTEEVSIAIDRGLDAIKNTQMANYSNTPQMVYINGSRIVYQRPAEESISMIKINGCGGMQPALLSYIRSDKLVRTFFELLGTNDLEHLIAQIHPKLPGDGIAYPRHRDIQFRKEFDPDWQDVLGNGSYAICIMPIDPMTPENGGLWIDRNNYPEPQGLEPDLVWIYAEPGDLLFMHPMLFHGSGPNLHPTASRKTLLTGFCAFGANHKAYPGAAVNTRLTLTEEGKIKITTAPWSADATIGPGTGH